MRPLHIRECNLPEEYWYGDNALDEGYTPARPSRGTEWGAPLSFPSVDRPFVWSGDGR